jgi:ubiquinone/menaquinone biosynthesis C-methylase UbiE
MRAWALLGVTLCLGCGGVKRCLYEGVGRDDWQKPDEVVALLDIREGSRVADLGAGGGYFTFRLADAVGEAGRVYAVDVDESMLAYLRERAAREGRDNVEVVHGTFDDPQLPDGEIDLLFTSNTYHHIQNRADYFGRLLGDLAPNGRVAIVEFDDSGSWFSRTFGHHTVKAAITDEMERAGYRLTHDHDILDRQSFLVFAPRD